MILGDLHVVLHNGDCLEYMRGMEAGSVDVVITDPLSMQGTDVAIIFLPFHVSCGMIGKDKSDYRDC
jgi:DNA modification methylase